MSHMEQDGVCRWSKGEMFSTPRVAPISTATSTALAADIDSRILRTLTHQCTNQAAPVARFTTRLHQAFCHPSHVACRARSGPVLTPARKVFACLPNDCRAPVPFPDEGCRGTFPLQIAGGRPVPGWALAAPAPGGVCLQPAVSAGPGPAQ
jgi:hypothetical protein